MKRRLDQLLKFRQLRMVEALARHPSLTRAAAVLGLTQPALTKAIRDLEAMVGEPLFERHARGMRLTATGQMVVAYARSALGDLHRFEEALDLKSDLGARSVVVGALPVAAVGLLPLVIMRARTEHPTLQVRLVEGTTQTLLAQLEAGDVDLVVGRLYPSAHSDGLERETLYAEPLSIMARAGHPLHRLKRPAVKDLVGFDLVLPTFSQLIGRDIEQFMEGLGWQPPVGSIRSTSRGFIREMVLNSDMITLMPRIVMGGDLLRGQVRVVNLAAPVQPRPAGVITNPQRGLSPGGQLTVDLIRRTIDELSVSGSLDITK